MPPRRPPVPWRTASPRYIELNPVRAAMVALPEQYRGSSVHANLGLSEDPRVSPHPVFLAQDRDAQTRAASYRTWLREGIGEGGTYEHPRAPRTRACAGRCEVPGDDRKDPGPPGPRTAPRSAAAFTSSAGRRLISSVPFLERCKRCLDRRWRLRPCVHPLHETAKRGRIAQHVRFPC